MRHTGKVMIITYKLNSLTQSSFKLILITLLFSSIVNVGYATKKVNGSISRYNEQSSVNSNLFKTSDIYDYSTEYEHSLVNNRDKQNEDLDDNLDKYQLAEISSYIAEKTEKELGKQKKQESVEQFNYVKSPSKIILFVWDGLRRDVITPLHTPNLYKLKENGTYFSDHHSSYPTVTMNNANSIATGNYAGLTGFYGNIVWRPDLIRIPGLNFDFTQPTGTEKQSILQALDQSKIDKPLLYVETLLQKARQYGLSTVQVGKAGPVGLQNINLSSEQSIIVTTDKIYPENFAKNLLNKGYFLPKKAVESYPDVTNKLKKDSNNPTEKSLTKELISIDGKIPLVGLSNPQDSNEAKYQSGNEYFMDIFLKEILSNNSPDLSIIWLREPDTTEHTYGPGSKSFYLALENQDKLLGKLLLYINKLGLVNNTNLIIASDHGHSNVSANIDLFPLRTISNGQIGELSNDGYSVSGYIRIADVLTKAGFRAFDGQGCSYNPVQHGILANGSLVATIEVDKEGSICGQGKGALYTTPSYKVPKELPVDSVVIANNRGSAFLYVPSGNHDIVKKLVRFLQSRQEFDSIFVDSLYGAIPGTLPLKTINFYDSKEERHPDIVVSMSYDDKALVQGLAGTEYSNVELDRGSHGSLSPIDINAVFIGYGPNFKDKYIDLLPTGNVDLPVTMAYILNLPFFDRQGRPALEALKNSGVKASDYELRYKQLQPQEPARELKIQAITNMNEKESLTDKDTYTFVMNTKELSYKSFEYMYIDSSKAVRY